MTDVLISHWNALNECGEEDIERQYMETHLEDSPLQPLNSPYREADCTYKILYKNMESHIKNSMEEHLFIAQKTHIERLA